MGSGACKMDTPCVTGGRMILEGVVIKQPDEELS
jgi:hypothetical protein